MGVVYLAEDEQLRRMVALKVLSPLLATDEAFQERFRNEARLVSSLMHQNIVYVNSLDRIDESLMIDMEFVDGRSVAELQQGSVVSASWAVEIMRQMLVGLAACHELGVVHRDLKPANVLVAADGRTKIADFGIATAMATVADQGASQRSTTGVLFGTPQYVAPEAWDGADATPTWDLYATGVMMHELISGDSLLASMSPLAIARNIALGVQPLHAKELSGTSPELQELVFRLTSIDPADRPVDAVEVQRVLVQLPEFVEVNDVEATTMPMHVVPALSRRLAGGVRRGRRLATLFSLLAVVFVAIGTSAWLQTNGIDSSTSEIMSDRNPLVVLHETLTGMPDGNALAAAWRTTPAEIEGIYRLHAVDDGGDGETITLLLERKTDVTHFLAWSDYAVWSGIIMPAGEKKLTMKGEWGSYGNPYGASIRYGNVNGSGAWMGENGGLVLTASLRNIRDNSERTVIYAGERVGTAYTDTRFFLDLETAQGVQPLLVNDLVPRGLGWARAILNALPAIPGQKLVVPSIEGTNTFLIDGLLQEPHWSQRFYDGSGRIGEILSRSTLRPGFMYARYNDDGIALGFEAEIPPGADIALEMAFIADLSTPMSDSTSYRLTLESGRPFDASQEKGGLAMAWLPAVEFATATDGGTWSAEIYLPWPAFSKSSIHPSVLRMNCILVEREGHGASQPLHQWGHPTIEAVEHGVWVTFNEP